MADPRHSYRGFENLPLLKAGGRETDGLLVVRQSSPSTEVGGMSVRLPDAALQLAAIRRRHRSHISMDGRTFFDGVQNPGEFSIFGPEGRLDVTAWAQWDCVSVILPWSTMTDLAERCGLVRHPGELEMLPRASHADAEIHELSGQMARELARTDQFTPWRMDVLAQRLAVALLRGHSNRSTSAAAAERARTTAPLSLRQHARATELLDALPPDELDLASLADAIDVAPERFADAFRATTGTTPLAWLIGRRIDQAKRRLLRSSEPLEGVAAALGFPSAAALSDQFLTVVGTTPEDWLRSARQ